MAARDAGDLVGNGTRSVTARARTVAGGFAETVRTVARSGIIDVLRVYREQLKSQCGTGLGETREQVGGGPSSELREGKEPEEGFMRGESKIEFVSRTPRLDVFCKQSHRAGRQSPAGDG